jgi:hypothetical protein
MSDLSVRHENVAMYIDWSREALSDAIAELERIAAEAPDGLDQIALCMCQSTLKAALSLSQRVQDCLEEMEQLKKEEAAAGH